MTLSFTATGDDRACGTVERYEVRAVPGSVSAPSWPQAQRVAAVGEPATSGQADDVVAGPLASGVWTLMLRAYDDAGNGSAPRAVTVSVPS